jgi:hypothetical protein
MRTLASLLEPSSPLKRIRDKRKAEELRNVVVGDAPAPLRLRAALAGGVKPPGELLEASVISQAIQLDDCFKFLPQLSPVRRIIETGPVLEAIGDLFRQRRPGNARLSLHGQDGCTSAADENEWPALGLSQADALHCRSGAQF